MLVKEKGCEPLRGNKEKKTQTIKMILFMFFFFSFLLLNECGLSQYSSVKTCSALKEKSHKLPPSVHKQTYKRMAKDRVDAE